MLSLFVTLVNSWVGWVGLYAQRIFKKMYFEEKGFGGLSPRKFLNDCMQNSEFFGSQLN